ncbi:unnamed protein product [Symbiodinium pilosum]|uniref:Amino acid transporter transmembrane domain-containing protein n=1 Tax=Symbiodinium pilosum TaxID=2952 RepID=A0A812TC22_SYMPI|nr:unnamed protein product [Symbiodinium pilosum]
MSARVKWLSATTVCMMACCLVANLVPLFQEFVNLTGALLSTQCVFVLPGILSAVSNEKRCVRVCAACTAVFGLYLAVAGTICSMAVIVEKLASSVERTSLDRSPT